MAAPEGTGLWIPKKKVPVEIRTITGDLLQGAMYVDVKRVDGSRGRVIERLNDRAESFLPVALEDRHLLVRKSSIVSVQVRGDEPPVVVSKDDAVFQVRIDLATGQQVRGRIHGLLASVHGRTLDLLNRHRGDFLGVTCEHGLAAVNNQHIVAVREENDAGS